MIFAKPGFVAYLTAGDGGIDYSFTSALALIAGGVTLLEIGIPFSDPVADGPTIQQAMNRALKNGTTPSDVLNLIRRLREHTSIPIVLFTYYNPILQAGPHFLRQAKEAGADGILIVDLPFEEKIPLEGLERIQLITPSTPTARMQEIAAAAEGFIYYVIQKGTTGARSSLPQGTGEKIAKIKQYTALPVIAGFGISTPESAQEVLNYADGFVVGSFFVEAMGRRISSSDLQALANIFNFALKKT